MKTYKNIFKATSLLAVMSLAMTSCNDWLTVHPQTQIVEENFWEDKNDLEGVRYGVYKNMANQVEKMIIWGDLRASDIYNLTAIRTSDQGNRDNFRNIIQADIDTTWSYYDWSGMYTTIGYCNKVLQHGAEVLEKDKQFTASEWRQMKAEMVTMRALSYFYLVRAFKSIPYTTKVVNSDTEVEYFPQLPVLDVMDSLINDVESVAGQARNRFVEPKETKGMITNTAIYALLSDMYLWRASLRQGRSAADSTITQDMVIEDYQKCILNSELSISKLKDQFDEERKGAGASIGKNDYVSWSGAPTFNGKTIDFMYTNDVDEANRGNFDLKAYRIIFTQGNSYESIFELQFNNSDGRKNDAVNSIWGPFNKSHLVGQFAYTGEETKGTYDIRYWFSAWNKLARQTAATDFYCLKWANADPVIANGIGTAEADIQVSFTEEEYNNWIVYRLSDVLLQNAEARACLAKLGVDATENNKVCQQILRMVNRRWWIDVVNGGDFNTNVNVNDANKADAYYNSTDYLMNVMNTRKREFIGEGKRWFDLVRYAERLSDSDEAVAGKDKMFDDFMGNIDGINVVKNRCENTWGLYCPIYYMECKAYRANGGVINQNPIWNKSKYDR